MDNMLKDSLRDEAFTIAFVEAWLSNSQTLEGADKVEEVIDNLEVSDMETAAHVLCAIGLSFKGIGKLDIVGRTLMTAAAYIYERLDDESAPRPASESQETKPETKTETKKPPKDKKQSTAKQQASSLS